MTTTTIRKKLRDYLLTAEERKVKAIYTMLEDEIEGKYDYWNDPDFLAELDRRTLEYKKGKVKGISWKEAKEKILRSSDSKKR